MDCLKNCVIIIPAKLCNQRKNFSHDVELDNNGILHFTFYIYITEATYLVSWSDNQTT